MTTVSVLGVVLGVRVEGWITVERGRPCERFVSIRGEASAVATCRVPDIFLLEIRRRWKVCSEISRELTFDSSMLNTSSLQRLSASVLPLVIIDSLWRLALHTEIAITIRTTFCMRKAAK